MIYETTYLINRYQLADVFRPDPLWGKRIFRVAASDLPDHTDSEIVDAARAGTPVGYRLHRVAAIGGDPHRRDVYFVPLVPPKRSEAQSA